MGSNPRADDLRLRPGRGFEVLLPPVAHRGDDRFQRGPELRQRVLHADRFLAHDFPVDDALFLEVLERIREYLAGDAVDVSLQFVEPLWAGLEESMNDYRVLLLPDERRHRGHGAPFLASAPDLPL